MVKRITKDTVSAIPSEVPHGTAGNFDGIIRVWDGSKWVDTTSSLQNLMDELVEWQNATFENVATLPIMEHLKEEVNELIDAQSVYESCPEIPEAQAKRNLEFADCFMLLFAAAAVEGLTETDIKAIVREKLGINKKRKWGKPNGKGVVNHLEE